jgi:DNA (cytosine-5)-methyltransferase 1
MVGISRATLYNWLRDQKVKEVARDRNNFRVFTEADIHKILEYKNLIKEPNAF